MVASETTQKRRDASYGSDDVGNWIYLTNEKPLHLVICRKYDLLGRTKSIFAKLACCDFVKAFAALVVTSGSPSRGNANGNVNAVELVGPNRIYEFKNMKSSYLCCSR